MSREYEPLHRFVGKENCVTCGLKEERHKMQKESDHKSLALAIVGDLALDFLYYDRKDDPELSVEDLDALLDSNELTLDEIVKEFKDTLERSHTKFSTKL